jgi:hypothetical protein
MGLRRTSGVLLRHFRSVMNRSRIEHTQNEKIRREERPTNLRDTLAAYCSHTSSSSSSSDSSWSADDTHAHAHDEWREKRSHRRRNRFVPTDEPSLLNEYWTFDLKSKDDTTIGLLEHSNDSTRKHCLTRLCSCRLIREIFPCTWNFN